MTEPMPPHLKKMRLRYAGVCTACGVAVSAGVEAIYNREARSVACLKCSVLEPLEEPTPVVAELAVDEVWSGVAGASAQREGDRRHDKREARIREAHPKLGGLILALSDDPQSTKAWSSGAIGEATLGRRLDKAVRDDVRVLHDRRIPGSRANIDHIVVCASGVFVIDAKRYVDKRPSLSVEGGFFRPRVEKLMVGSRDQTKLVVGVQGQVQRVLAVLAASGLELVPVRGMLCFVDGEWPLFGGDFEIDGVDVLWPGKAIQHLVKSGVLGAGQVEEVHRLLASVFVPA